MASDEQDTTSESVTGRRGLLRWGAVGAGAAIAASVASVDRAAAMTGSTAVVGATNNNGDAQTGFVHNGSTQNGPALNAFRTSGATTGVQYSENAGLIAETALTNNDGVIGFCAGGLNSSGVHGFSFDGRGIVGTGDTGVGVLGEIRVGNSSPGSVAVKGTNGGGGLGGSFAGGLAPLLLVPATTTGAPTTGAHQAGELYVDANGGLFYCRAAGTPGTWVNVLAGAMHTVTPTRVYDSREAQPAPGPLSSGQSRTISVSDGRALVGGAVTVPNLVPAGATTIAYNLTIVNTVRSGFLSVNPGTNVTVTSSAINWFADGVILANASVVGIDASRLITVIAGGGGTTDFAVDVVGYS